METKLNSKGKRFFAPAIAAGLMLAMAFTLNACGGDGGGGGSGDEVSASSSSGNGSSSSSSSASSSSSGGDTPSSSSQPSPKCDEYNHDEKFCDERDGKLYKYIKINGQFWVAENLNYNVTGSKCGSALSGDGTLSDANTIACDTYGRLYNWVTAMGLDASCSYSACNSKIQSKHQGVCPSGWHIPSGADWDDLIAFIHVDRELGSFTSGYSDYAGKYLKAASGWNGSSGTDDYAFSAIPGGFGYSNGNFFDVGNSGYWWSASEDNGSLAYSRFMYSHNEDAGWVNYSKSNLYSVRCLRD